MKKQLSFLSALFVASMIFLAPGASTAFAKGGPAWARHGDREHGERHDRGRHLGQRKQWARENGRYRFDDDDRRRVDIYFRDHRDEYREHWRGEGPAIGFGYVIGRPYRRYCEPLPGYVLDELPPPPPGYRYYMYYGNVVLVDDDYRVQDYIHVNLNFGF